MSVHKWATSEIGRRIFSLPAVKQRLTEQQKTFEDRAIEMIHDKWPEFFPRRPKKRVINPAIHKGEPGIKELTISVRYDHLGEPNVMDGPYWGTENLGTTPMGPAGAAGR